MIAKTLVVNLLKQKNFKLKRGMTYIYPNVRSESSCKQLIHSGFLVINKSKKLLTQKKKSSQ